MLLPAKLPGPCRSVSATAIAAGLGGASREMPRSRRGSTMPNSPPLLPLPVLISAILGRPPRRPAAGMLAGKPCRPMRQCFGMSRTDRSEGWIGRAALAR